MQKKSLVEMERQRIMKVTRSLIRLKHSLNADEELNNSLPELLVDFDEAVQNGELKRLAISIEGLLNANDNQ